MGAQALTDLALGIGLSAAGVGQTGSAAAQLGSQIGIGLPYSRSLESRADQGGLMLMAKAGYNPQAAITLWEKMNKLDGAGGYFIPVDAHPSNSQRIEAMRKNFQPLLKRFIIKDVNLFLSKKGRPRRSFLISVDDFENHK